MSIEPEYSLALLGIKQQQQQQQQQQNLYTTQKSQKASSACTTLGPTSFVLLSHLFIPSVAPPQTNLKILYPLPVCLLFFFLSESW